jgi:hypothetical protein
MKSIPGWTINIDEISSGVFNVTLRDGYGCIYRLKSVPDSG